MTTDLATLLREAVTAIVCPDEAEPYYVDLVTRLRAAANAVPEWRPMSELPIVNKGEFLIQHNEHIASSHYDLGVMGGQFACDYCQDGWQKPSELQGWMPLPEPIRKVLP